MKIKFKKIMNNNQQLQENAAASRRKFVWLASLFSIFSGVAAATGLSLFRRKDIISCGPEPKRKTVRMLTQDGTLVEVDEALLTAARKKVTNDELQHWIKK
jgi:hypothetical protein